MFCDRPAPLTMTTSTIQDWLQSNLSLYVHGDLRKRIPLPGVYAIHFPLTDEVFFGQTKHLYRGRLKHLRALKRGVAENKGLLRAYRANKRAFDFYYINLPQQVSKEVAQDYIALHHDHPYLLNEARAGSTHKVHSTALADSLTSPNKPDSVRLEKKGLQRMSSNEEAAVEAPTAKVIKQAQLLTDAPLGVVYHTDGGARPNPGPGGWGIHGYLYRAVKPKKGSGNPDHVLTVDGYHTKADYNKQKELDWGPDDFQYWLDNPLGRKRYLEVAPVNYVDGFGWFAEPVTNNIAEMVAATAALEHAAQFDVKVVQVRADSQYVCKGLAEYVPTWIRNNWIKVDGFPVKNSEYWKKLVSARDVLVNRGVIVRVDWIKGHNDHLGNELADQAATIGVMKAQKLLYGKPWQFNPDGPAVVAYSDLTTAEAEGYWKYDTERHPFISMPRMYFNTCEEYCLPGVYYLGNGKEEEHPGKRISDGAFAVVKLMTPDPVLEMVRYYQGKLADNVMALAQARLDFIYRPDIHKKLTDHGPLVMVQADPARLDTYDLHSLDKDKTREPITRELKPPHLAMRAVENVELLTQKLNQYLSKDPEIVVTDLTDILYEKSQKVVKKETVDICTLNPKYNVGFAALEVNANYKTDEGISSAPVILTLGIDLIDRNALKRLETSHPKVSLISWLEAPHIFRYASIIEIDGCVGIWAGLYSNVRIVTPQSR
jgi:ribonuclease HI